MAESSLSISRWYHDDCVLGRLRCGDFQCYTLELPFKANRNSVSCVFPGLYTGFKRQSPSNGPCLQLEDRMGRQFIQIHVGNFLRDIEGCILVGDSIRLSKEGQPWVANSANTLKRLLQLLDSENVEVMISDR